MIFTHNNSDIEFEYIGRATNMSTVDGENSGESMVVYQSIEAGVLYVANEEDFKADFSRRTCRVSNCAI